MDEKLQSILRYYCDSAPELVEGLARIAAHQGEHPAPLAQFYRALQSAAHRMAGTAASLGFNEIGSLAGEFDDRLTAALNGAETAFGFDQIMGRIETLRLACRHLRAEDSHYWTDNVTDAGRELGAQGPASDFANNFLTDAVVLVADDDLVIRQLVRTTLVDAGAQRVLVAQSGQEALHIALSIQPDVIIADWRMDPVSGHDLLSIVRVGKSRLRPDTPFVMLTRLNASGAIRAAIEAGVDYFLLKPFTREGLLRAVKSAMNKHPRMDAPGAGADDCINLDPPAAAVAPRRTA